MAAVDNGVVGSKDWQLAGSTYGTILITSAIPVGDFLIIYVAYFANTPVWPTSFSCGGNTFSFAFGSGSANGTGIGSHLRVYYGKVTTAIPANTNMTGNGLSFPGTANAVGQVQHLSNIPGSATVIGLQAAGATTATTSTTPPNTPIRPDTNTISSPRRVQEVDMTPIPAGAYAIGAAIGANGAVRDFDPILYPGVKSYEHGEYWVPTFSGVAGQVGSSYSFVNARLPDPPGQEHGWAGFFGEVKATSPSIPDTFIEIAISGGNSDANTKFSTWAACVGYIIGNPDPSADCVDCTRLRIGQQNLVFYSASGTLKVDRLSNEDKDDVEETVTIDTGSLYPRVDSHPDNIPKIIYQKSTDTWFALSRNAGKTWDKVTLGNIGSLVTYAWENKDANRALFMCYVSGKWYARIGTFSGGTVTLSAAVDTLLTADNVMGTLEYLGDGRWQFLFVEGSVWKIAVCEKLSSTAVGVWNA